MIEPLGHRVIIKPDPVEVMSEGGIIFAQTEEFLRREKSETSTGIVVSYGPSAWLDPALGGEPWVEIGDRIVYAKYSGKFVVDPDSGDEYIVINDDSIQARVVKEK